MGIKLTMGSDVSGFVRNLRLVKLVLRVMELPDKTIKFERQAGIPRGYRYPLAEEFLGADAEERLEELADSALLERQLVAKEFGCPKCRSVNLSLRLHCPNCDSVEVERRGAQQVCRSCDEIFQAPIQKLTCARDDISFSISDAPEIGLYNYRLTPRLEEEANQAVDQTRYIQKNVEALGFKTQSPARLTGRSGGQQQFFLVATSGMGFMKTNIVIDIISNGTTREVFSLYAKAIEVGAYGVLFAAIPSLSDDAKKTADSYGMIYVEAEDLSMTAERLVKKFAELVENKRSKEGRSAVLSLVLSAKAGWKGPRLTEKSEVKKVA